MTFIVGFGFFFFVLTNYAFWRGIKTLQSGVKHCKLAASVSFVVAACSLAVLVVLIVDPKTFFVFMVNIAQAPGGAGK